MDYFKEWINNIIYGLDPKRVRIRRHHVTRYSLGRVRDFKSGCVAGIAGMLVTTLVLLDLSGHSVVRCFH
jgi:hypothetical protein